jgi:hypothetical protein
MFPTLKTVTMQIELPLRRVLQLGLPQDSQIVDSPSGSGTTEKVRRISGLDFFTAL